MDGDTVSLLFQSGIEAFRHIYRAVASSGTADAYGELGGLPLPDLPVTEPLPGAPVRITGRRAKRR